MKTIKSILFRQEKVSGDYKCRKDIIMNNIFAEMFSKEPPYIVDGDYYYFNPHYEEFSDELREHCQQMAKKPPEPRDYRNTWRYLWDSRTFQGRSPVDDPNSGTNIRQFWIMWEAINNGSSKINEIFSKVAAEGKPFMDISSCNTFGLIPFIVKMNSKIPCMATDMEAPVMRIMRSRVTSDLSEYNIRVASFDNRDIPIKDNSLDYVTSTYGIGSVIYDNAPHTFFQIPVDTQKPINEVYRILKPGGCYIAIEKYNDWKFDLAKAREACNRDGKLFGIYTYNEIEEVQNKLKVSSMHNQFIEAGFQVEIGEKYPYTSWLELNVKSAFSHLAHIFKIREWTDDEREEYKFFPQIQVNTQVNTKALDKEAEEFGIEFDQGEIFYVLRKL